MKLISAKYSAGAINFSLLLIRVIFGGVMAWQHGWVKLTNFSAFSGKFINFLGLGQSVSLSLTIFAEFFCAVLLVLGLLTRLAAIPLIIAMSVIVFMVHAPDGMAKQELPLLFLTAFVVLLVAGPGRYSVDNAIGK
ncbi:DoxX family protein [Chitinophaga lutea]